MIKDRAIVARYGEAFVKYARSALGTEQIVEDLKKLRKILRDHQDLKLFFENPGISLVDKGRVADAVFKEDLAVEVVQFLKLVISHKRITHLEDIVEYVRLKYSHFGEQEVLIKTSYLLDLDLIRKIEQALEKKLNQKCKFYIELDSRILGGIQVVVGNRVLDGSVRGRLNDLKKKLQAIRVN
ncbi:MAG TPA: ATP synthase F1 subunit delta [Candidatus Omnitrophota bacterium]|nr:ATP synthase F1 subunit delta [Candidatus Omnitrophota bacterium]HQL41508.1 ATP synthase F1 subunit delta [Candidatus Omnitrophota bacterium]